MSHPVRTALLAACLALAAGAAEAQSPAKSFLFQERFRNACRPPLKFAAGACVRRCPAGYENVGRYCRLRNSSSGRGR